MNVKNNNNGAMTFLVAILLVVFMSKGCTINGGKDKPLPLPVPVPMPAPLPLPTPCPAPAVPEPKIIPEAPVVVDQLIDKNENDKLPAPKVIPETTVENYQWVKKGYWTTQTKRTGLFRNRTYKVYKYNWVKQPVENKVNTSGCTTCQ